MTGGDCVMIVSCKNSHWPKEGHSEQNRCVALQVVGPLIVERKNAVA